MFMGQMCGHCIGGQFQIIWDKKKTTKVKDVDQDVYNLLNLIREAFGGNGIALLGVDVDDLGEDGMVSSPEHDPCLPRLCFDESPKGDRDSRNGFCL